jgi:hypothetical protein
MCYVFRLDLVYQKDDFEFCILTSDIIQIIRKLLKRLHRHFLGRTRIMSQDFKYNYKPVLQIRMFLGLLDLDPDSDLLVRDTDTDPSIIKQK